MAKQGTILVVDDNKGILTAVQMLLGWGDRKRGFTYDCRRSPYESVCFYMGGERLSVGDHDFFAVVIVDGRDLGVSEGVYDRVAVI